VPKMTVLGKVAQPASENGAHLRLVSPPAPIAVNGKVAPPRRLPNRDRRSREHLTPAEVETLMEAASKIGRHGHRDATLILLAYRHGLRVGELVALRWDQVDLKAAWRTPSSAPVLKPLSASALNRSPTRAGLLLQKPEVAALVAHLGVGTPPCRPARIGSSPTLATSPTPFSGASRLAGGFTRGAHAHSRRRAPLRRDLR
jgi:integrase